MFKQTVLAIAIVLAMALPAVVRAQTNPQLEEIRKQIQELKDSYDARIQALEKQLKDAETASAKAQTTATEAQSAAMQAKQAAEAVQAPPPTQPTSSNAFNPALSLILQGGYYNSSQNPNTRSITGFLPQRELGLPERGFYLGETELTLSANVDHLFYGQATLSVDNGNINAEEAFFQTTSLGHGLTGKGGRFFSGIGYENSQHQHNWDFADDALVQQSFLGPNFTVDGLQVSWIAPTPLYLELGAEAGKPVEFPFPVTEHNANGIQVATLFARLGGDIGVSNSYLVGAWALQAKNSTNDQPVGFLDGTTGVSNIANGGNTKLWGLNFVYKWAPEGDRVDRNFKLIAEWMHRSYDSTLMYAPGTPGAQTGDFTANQSGWFVQGVYQFEPAWRVGLRYGQLDEGSYDLGPGLVGAPGLTTPDFTPKRVSAMVDWSPSEFSRFRLQFNQDKSQIGITDNQVYLQYILSLGTHGAHKF
jgi:hypothetical protein